LHRIWISWIFCVAPIDASLASTVSPTSSPSSTERLLYSTSIEAVSSAANQQISSPANQQVAAIDPTVLRWPTPEKKRQQQVLPW
jgi:hypothetical protein